MDKYINLGHGSGGKMTQNLVSEIFAARFRPPEPLTDSALIYDKESIYAFTTDSYVVDPVFFPGGNIGSLAVCGTVNDLAVSGAIPDSLSAAFIIEEGFPVDELVQIADTMSEMAEKAEVRIVTGDTKVVGKGKCDRLFITTSGVGRLDPVFRNIGNGSLVKAGDKVIINGPVGNHSVAVLGARNKMSFSAPVLSDCAPLNHMIRKVLKNGPDIHFMRDVTRGGLASVLNELAAMTTLSVLVNESDVPMDEPVKGICEILGFDPFYLANEGKVIFVCQGEVAGDVLRILRSDEYGIRAEIIGEIIQSDRNQVFLNTTSGGKRIIDMPSGVQLPRIC